jgi:hypothetical protein
MLDDIRGEFLNRFLLDAGQPHHSGDNAVVPIEYVKALALGSFRSFLPLVDATVEPIPKFGFPALSRNGTR